MDSQEVFYIRRYCVRRYFKYDYYVSKGERTMRYIVRSCKKCEYYEPNEEDADPCVRCRRYADDYYREREQ